MSAGRPIVDLADSCLATVKGAFLVQFSVKSSRFLPHSGCSVFQRHGAGPRVQSRGGLESATLTAEQKGMTDSHCFPNKEGQEGI
jgi:hypothetical protein